MTKEWEIKGEVGDLVRVTLSENPSTGFTTLNNALKLNQSNSLSGSKYLSPAEDHVIELNSYYAQLTNLGLRGNMPGQGGSRVMTF